MNERNNVASIWYMCQKNENMKKLIYAWSKEEGMIYEYVHYHHHVLQFDRANFHVIERKYHRNDKLKDFEEIQSLFQLVRLHGNQSPVVTVAEKILLIPILKPTYENIQQYTMSIMDDETADDIMTRITKSVFEQIRDSGSTETFTENFPKFIKEHYDTFDCFLNRMDADTFSRDFSMHPIVASIVYSNKVIHTN